MAKAPVLGRVKTRLAREIGAVEATRFYRSMVRAVLWRIGRDTRFETSIGLATEFERSSRAAAFPSLLSRINQRRGDLGRRMMRLAEATPRGPVVIVGTDIPGITARALVDALKLLGGHDVVIGPADDGGFWLVGFSRRRPIPRRLFCGVRWSTRFALGDVLANGRDLRVGIGATLSDVDTSDDLNLQRHAIGRVILRA